MNEQTPITPESGPEYIPTPEEVTEVLDHFIDGREFEELVLIEDEKGLKRRDVYIKGEGGKDDEEYCYKRAGECPEGETPSTAIEVGYIDQDGIPTGGKTIAKVINGELKVLEE